MATGGGPSKPLPPYSQPEVDALIPHLDYEVNIEDDSDGINLKNTEVVRSSEEATASTVSVTSYVLVPETPTLSTPLNPSAVKVSRPPKKKEDHLDQLTKARLGLVEKEESYMKELHDIRMEEAKYKAAAAKFVMLQEEAKWKKSRDE